MSKLDDLIQKLCPDGVEHKPLSEIFNTRNGYTPSKKEKNFWENGTVPWFRMEDIRENGGILDHAMQYVSINAIKGDPFPENSIIVATSATIGEHALITVPSIANQRFTYLMVKEQYKDDYDPKFLYYYCFKLDEYCKECLNQGNFASVDMKKFAKFQFPRLPIEIQREIVRMLDSYTESVVELQRQLTAELIARKTQYAYYRDSLLSMKSQWYHVKIIDMLSQPITDGPHTTPQFVQNGVPFVSVDSIWDGKIHFEKMRGYITEAFDEECCKKYKPQKNDVYMVKSGSTTGKVAFVDTDIRFNIWSPLAAMRVNEQNSARFLFYLLQTEKVQKQVKAKASHGSQPNLGMRELEHFEVDVPPLDVQNRIVEVLDNFEKICSDLNIGLPAEIEARQKQYEYYRDKLLTFAETGNTILSRAEQSRAEQSRAEQSRALIKLLQYVFGYVRISLGDIGSICMCKRILKSQTNTVSGVPFYKIGTFGKEADAYISQETFNEYRSKYNFPKKGDVLISAAGTIGRTVVYDGKPAYFQDSNIVWIDNDESIVLNSYLRYCYELKPWKASEGGTIPRLYNDNIAKAVIAVPSIEEQKRVVSILDRFDAICNDLTSGLPAEIEARQKQYEYYRDKLLTFKEVATT